ncbi:hypothetical protein ACE6H2_019020 [Prunus campanulata]
MTSSSGGGRYMSYSPSPSAPHSPHLSGLRSASSAALVAAEQEKYLSELLAERHKLGPFLPLLPHCCRLINQGQFRTLNSASYCLSKLLLWVQLQCSNVKTLRSVTAQPESNDSNNFTEILRVTTLLGNASVLGQSGLEHASPLASGGMFSNGGADVNGWASRFQSEVLTYLDSTAQMSGLLQPSSTQNWLNSPSSSSGLIVKRTIRVDIPVDKYPNYNFVGRLLGPRGNSLKRVEATTECRVLIRGRGSIKDPTRVIMRLFFFDDCTDFTFMHTKSILNEHLLRYAVNENFHLFSHHYEDLMSVHCTIFVLKEEMMRGKPGYEHLNEPLHILVEAELPVEIIDARLSQAREVLEDLLRPVDESQDFYKKQQLRELAMLNGTLREEGSPMSGSVSPFHNSLGMKRAKTRG